MARAGATGSTASQMDAVLRANGWGDLGSGMGSLEQILNGYNATWEDGEGTRHALSLNMVNRAFGQDGWTIKPSYLDRIGSAFGAGLALVDYAADPDAARDTINAWVARQTRDRIKKLLGPTDITSATRLALVNAIYMKANWANEFDPDRTVNRPFATSIDTTDQGPDHAHGGRAGHRARAGRRLEGHRAQVRRGERFAPLDDADPARRPRPVRGRAVGRPSWTPIAASIAREQKRIQKIIPQDDGDMDCPAFAYDVNLSLPKFGIDTRAGLVPILKAMGMRDAIERQQGRLLRDHRRPGHVHRARDPPGEHRRRRDRDGGRGRDGGGGRHDRRLRFTVRAQAQEAAASTTRSCS